MVMGLRGVIKVITDSLLQNVLDEKTIRTVCSVTPRHQ